MMSMQESFKSFKLPKKLSKIAKLEKQAKNEIRKQQVKFAKLNSQPTIKCSFGHLPALYKICGLCKGHGKLTINSPNPNLKFASTDQYLNYLQVKTCHECDGKRVVKILDKAQCSEEQISAFAADKKNKSEKKMKKKLDKAEKKANKAFAKLKDHKLALEDPETHAALRAKKAEEKAEKKALKKANKAVKKAKKAKNKVEKLKEKMSS